MSKKSQLLVVVGALLYLIAGCQATDSRSDTHTVDAVTTPIFLAPVTSQPDPLDGTRWELVAFEGESKTLNIPEKPRLFVVFHKGSLGLEGGCNQVGGYYRIKNDHITITFAEATQVDCSEQMPGINEIEKAFTDAMPAFNSYTIDGDWLRIRYAGGEILFRRAAK